MRFTLSNDRFPAGTTVGAYLASREWPGAGAPPATQGPKSAPDDTKVAAATGLTFDSLEPEEKYWAVAQVDGAYRWVRFSTEPSQTADFSNDDPEDVTFRSNAPADQVADVFQQFIGGVKVVYIDAAGNLHLNGGSTEDGRPFLLAPSVVEIPALTGASTVDMTGESEVWVVATLTGDATLLIENLPASAAVVELILTQDGTGAHALTISDGNVSTVLQIDERANATTRATVQSPDGVDLVISGGSEDKPPRLLTADHTATTADVGRTQIYTTSGPAKLIIPFDQGAFRPGDTIRVAELGAGQVQLVGEASVALLAPSNGYRGVKRGALVQVVNLALNVWVIDGDTTPTYTFDPLSLTPSLLLEADRVTGLNDGDVGATWADASGAGNNATAAGSVRPTYKLGGIGGLPAWEFDGSDDGFAVAAILNNDPTRTIFVVGRRSSGASSGTLWHLNDNAMVHDDGAGHLRYLRNEAVAEADLGVISGAFVHAIRFNSAASADSWLNGGAPINFNPHDSFQTPGTNSLTIGKTATGVRQFPGKIAAVIVVDSALSDPNVAAMIAYLQTKFGV